MIESLRIGGGVWAVAVLLLATWCSGSRAEDAPAGSDSSASGFSAILERQTRQTLAEVAEYLTQHPDAADAEAAYRWLFTTARESGLEQIAVALAEMYLKRAESDPAIAEVARQVRALGLAKAGKAEEALQVFQDHLKGVRFRSSAESLDFAAALAAQLQLAGDVAAAREVYERTKAAFFLNAEVRQFADRRLEKLALVGKPAPSLQATDVQGEPFDLSRQKGQVVIVDFWATHCPPCLEEFPRMKQLYADLHAKGLEIIGVSLDDNPETVRAFQQKAKIPWRTLMNDEQTAARFAVETIPSLFVVDRTGTVVAVDVSGPDLRKVVTRALAQE